MDHEYRDDEWTHLDAFWDDICGRAVFGFFTDITSRRTHDDPHARPRRYQKFLHPR